MFDTLLPGPLGGLRKVDLFPVLAAPRDGGFSRVRLDALVLEGLAPDEALALAFGGGEDGLEDLPKRTSFPLPLNVRFSGEWRREDASDWAADPIGPGMRLPVA